MADRRALSLSFFKKPCGRGRDRQTDRGRGAQREGEKQRNRERKQETLAATFETK